MLEGVEHGLHEAVGQTLQLIDIAVSVVLEGKPAVGVEFPQSPGLVDSSEKKYLISV